MHKGRSLRGGNEEEESEDRIDGCLVIQHHDNEITFEECDHCSRARHFWFFDRERAIWGRATEVRPLRLHRFRSRTASATTTAWMGAAARHRWLVTRPTPLLPAVVSSQV